MAFIWHTAGIQKGCRRDTEGIQTHSCLIHVSFMSHSSIFQASFETQSPHTRITLGCDTRFFLVHSPFLRLSLHSHYTCSTTKESTHQGDPLRQAGCAPCCRGDTGMCTAHILERHRRIPLYRCRSTRALGARA